LELSDALSLVDIDYDAYSVDHLYQLEDDDQCKTKQLSQGVAGDPDGYHGYGWNAHLADWTLGYIDDDARL
jgi:hypothetical protein